MTDFATLRDFPLYELYTCPLTGHSFDVYLQIIGDGWNVESYRITDVVEYDSVGREVVLSGNRMAHGSRWWPAIRVAVAVAMQSEEVDDDARRYLAEQLDIRSKYYAPDDGCGYESW